MRKRFVAFIFIAAIGMLNGCAKNADIATEENQIQEEIFMEESDDETAEALPSDPPVADDEEFPGSRTQTNKWFTIDLPEGYTLLEYDENVGNAGGSLISPLAYEVLGEDSYGHEMDWTMSGSIGIIPNVPDFFIFEDGQIEDVIPLWNHSSFEKVESLDGFEMAAILYSVNHDLYTAADMGNLEEQGIYLAPEDTTSDYWYIFFAKEHSDEGYYLALDQKQFTKEDALDIAGTMKEKNVY